MARDGAGWRGMAQAEAGWGGLERAGAHGKSAEDRQRRPLRAYDARGMGEEGPIGRPP